MNPTFYALLTAERYILPEDEYAVIDAKNQMIEEEDENNPSPFKILGTHHEYFHADEVFATALLLVINPFAKVVRSRNENVLRHADLVYDVGCGKYDHHTTEKVYRDDIPFAAFGLIWRDYGKQYLRTIGIAEEFIADVHKTVDEHFIQGIDAVDNGMRLEKAQKITDVSEVIFSFNPTWDNERDENEAFMEAVSVAALILKNKVLEKTALLKSRVFINQSFKKRTHPQVLVLNKACNWTQQLLYIDKKEEVLFVVYPNKYEGYRIQVVPKKIGDYEARKDLPAPWAGKTKEELNELIGITDAVFCHPARFIAGAGSLESCMKMVELALK